MVRVSKEYDERLNELLDAGQQLFFQKGYELTSVNDIIEKVGVAKGTFYHYFNSKDDLLDKIVERWTLASLERVERLVMNQEHLNAVEKLNLFFITIRDYKVESLELMKMLM
ncbi:MAG: TetR/AcrR family transcriptional regulator, partial [Candidatus Aminicenantes bacterium]|nr:TetR/AcrR family transcriptional regulator [Candidatus Aminicenantes bacterium]